MLIASPAATLLLAVGLLTAVDAAPEPRPAAAPSLEKRVADLEAEVAALRKEIQGERGRRHAPLALKVVNVRGLDLREAARLCRRMFSDRRGFRVEVFAKSGFLLVRADERTMKEAVELLQFLQPLGPAAPSPAGPKPPEAK